MITRPNVLQTTNPLLGLPIEGRTIKGLVVFISWDFIPMGPTIKFWPYVIIKCPSAYIQMDRQVLNVEKLCLVFLVSVEASKKYIFIKKLIKNIFPYLFVLIIHYRLSNTVIYISKDL